MNEQKKHIILTLVMAVFLFGMAAWCLLKPAQEISTAERRELEQLPELSTEEILSGRFMTEFEDYTLDQFPLRDSFRTLKALSANYLFRHLDNNDIYLAEGHLSKLEYPLNGDSLTRAAEVFRSVYDRYLDREDISVYFSIIPDKNYFMAEKSGHLSMDYQELVDQMTAQTEFMTYLDIFPLLELEDYYRTDSHWRQEKILDVAAALAEGMGRSLGEQNYIVNTLPEPFYGVYHGQSALPLEGEELHYLTSEVLENCLVYDHQNGREMSVYDLTKGEGDDPYELFLSGSLSLITIENPSAQTDRELVIFRDSFGSSITPLLVSAYSKVTVVDIRYLQSARLGDFIQFGDQDVLFLYSTMVLNNSETLK